MRRWFTSLLLVVVAASCGDDTGGTDLDAGSDNIRTARDAGGNNSNSDMSGQADGGADADTGPVIPPDAECVVDADCSDDVFCNGVERCFEYECFPSPVPQCTDPSECTQDNCNEDEKRCEFVPDDSLCAPGQVCDSKAGCFTPAECATDTDCNDGLLCNGTETCSDGECQPGEPVVCDDGVACTADTCVETIGDCQSVADHTRCLATELCGLLDGCAERPPCNRDDDCDDGLFCNGTETCVMGLCAAGTPPVVVDSVSCTIDQCSEASDMVLHVPDNARCSDGQFCNGFELCHPQNGCGPGTPPSTSDGVSCTDDSCNELLDFIEHVPNNSKCDDGLFCNGTETCDPIDDCQVGEPPVLNDGVGCTVDTCSEVNDEVVHVPDDGLCNDNLYCNGVETCDAVNDCQSGTPPNIDDGVDCTTDSCDESNDTSLHVPNDAFCGDNDVCNGIETCHLTNGCQMGTDLPTDDGVACTVDMCDAINGVVHMPDDSLCNDGAWCNGEETCDAQLGCRAGTPPTAPDDGVACTDAVCNESTDSYDQVPDDNFCDNDDVCDGTETCDATNDCQMGTPPTIDDSDPCTADSCDPQNGVSNVAVSDGTSCGSNLICVSGNCGASVCGDGYLDPNSTEECDDGNTTGGDGCDGNCVIEAVCDVDDVYSVTPVIDWSCPGNEIQIDIAAMEFRNDGINIDGLAGRTVNDLNGYQTGPLDMVGVGAECTGSFQAYRLHPSGALGGCIEEYEVNGTFTDQNNWNGTLTITLTLDPGPFGIGSCGTCPQGVQTFTIAGSR